MARQVIEHLRIENFKIHRHFEPPRDFGRFNVLIGPNGVGKSSVFQAMELLCGVVQQNLGDFIKERGWAYDDLPNLRDKSKSITLTARISLLPNQGQDPMRLIYEVKIVPRRYLTIGYEKATKLVNGASDIVLLERENRDVHILDESRPAGTPPASMQFLGASSAMAMLNDPRDKIRYRTLSALRKFLEGIRHYTIWNPKELQLGTKRLQPKLEPSGRNLPSVIGYLAKHAPRNVEKLIGALQEEFPWLENVVSKGGPYGSRTLLVKAKHGRRSQEYRATQVSDGFLRILALATMTYQEDKPTVLAFEEPENGVHPQLLHFQVESLLRLSSASVGHAPQVFLATHSPLLLDYVPLESVLVMTADPKGEVRVQAINKSAPLLHDAGLLPGEAWAYRGERALIAKPKRLARKKRSPFEPPQFIAPDGSVEKD
jgi:predicted ATPase